MAPKISKSKPSPPSTPTPSAKPTPPQEPPLFFYGHTAPPHDFLSQHYACTFAAPPLSFPSPSASTSAAEQTSKEEEEEEEEEEAPLAFLGTEQYMMYHKALLFDDAEIAARVMEEGKPAAQKALGRKVRGFEDVVWTAHRERIVEANWWKFSGGVDWAGLGLRERLLETGERELVEASPRDRIWGIGFGKVNAEANRERWGLNLLGKALMRVRDRLRELEAENGDMEEDK